MRSERNLILAAMAGACLMMAHQVAGKAARDSVFLSAFAVSALPRMVIAASVTAIVLTLVFARLLARLGPRRVVSGGFLLSAGLHVLEWRLLGTALEPAAVMTYLHIVGFGAILLSGFWSIANEAFDPPSAKRLFGRIAGAGTAGGILGGVLAERLSVMLPAQDVLLLLAVLHLGCGLVLAGIRTYDSPPPAGGPEAALWPRQVFKRAPHLRTLAVLVVLGTTSAAMLDYLFKSGATAAYGKGAPLLRFFALFYTSVQLVTLLVQTLAARRSLEKLGLARTVGSLPLSVAGFSGLGLLFPAFPVFASARAAESVFRGSLFRSGYELLYTPVAPAEKRAAKTIIDVGFDRAGDALGAGIVQLFLVLGAAFITTELLGITLATALAAAWLASRLDRVYTSVIEKRLVEQALVLDPGEVKDATTLSAVMRTAVLRNVEAGKPRPRMPAATAPLEDEIVERLRGLRSGKRERVIAVLEIAGRRHLVEISQAIQLLAWNEVVDAARGMLEREGPRITGMLIDQLADEANDFAIRRRVPRILARLGTQAAYDGLLRGLEDSRFEVRFQCARALDFMARRGAGLERRSPAVYDAIRRELSLAPALLENRRLLDQPDGDTELAFLDPDLRERSDKNAEYLFSLLAVVLPREPLQVAFRSFHSADRGLRGLAIEYLDTVLPPDLSAGLRRMFDAGVVSPAAAGRSADEIAGDLLASQVLKTATPSGGDALSESATRPKATPPSEAR